MQIKDDDKVAVLQYVHQSWKSESQIHRENLFNTFAWWTTALLTIAGVLVVFPASLAAYPIVRVMIVVIVVGLSYMITEFMKSQRRFSAQALAIAVEIERALCLFEEGAYISGKSIVPPDHAKVPEETPTKRDRVQINVIYILTVVVLLAALGLPR